MASTTPSHNNNNNHKSIKATKSEDEQEDDTNTNNNNNMVTLSSKKKNAVQAQNTPSAQAAASFKLMLLIGMVVQNSSTVLVGRHTRSSVPAADLYVVNHLILITEVGKCILSCILEHFATNGNLWNSIQQNILNNPLDALKISVPALLYLVQNSLLYVALSNLSAPLFQVTYQCKLVTTAIVSVIMLNRKYNVKQWICLVGLSLGVAIVVLGEQKPKNEDSNAAQEEKDESESGQSLMVGLVAVTIACMSSALAGVYFEKVLKKPAASSVEKAAAAPVSVWMRNMQLAFFSMLIATGQMIYSQTQSNPEEAPKPFGHGFTFWVWILVVLQAGGGLLVAAVIKYADNVLKGLATGVSVVVGTTFSMVFFGTPVSGQFLGGAVLILTSVYFFSNHIPPVCLALVGKSVTTATSSTSSSPNDEDSAKVEMKPLVVPLGK